MPIKKPDVLASASHFAIQRERERETKNDNSHIAPSFLAHFILVHILVFLTIEGLTFAIAYNWVISIEN